VDLDALRLVVRTKNSKYKQLVNAIEHNLKTFESSGVICRAAPTCIMILHLAKFLAKLDIFSYLELFKNVDRGSSQTTSPNRKPGKLKEGYEFNFPVLLGNPIRNLKNIDAQKIEIRVIQRRIQK